MMVVDIGSEPPPKWFSLDQAPSLSTNSNLDKVIDATGLKSNSAKCLDMQILKSVTLASRLSTA